MNKEILEVMKESEDFIAAVASAMKSSTEEQISITDCPCGGKIKFWYSNCNGHKTVIAKCNQCRREIRGSSGALEAYERENRR